MRDNQSGPPKPAGTDSVDDLTTFTTRRGGGSGSPPAGPTPPPSSSGEPGPDRLTTKFTASSQSVYAIDKVPIVLHHSRGNLDGPFSHAIEKHAPGGWTEPTHSGSFNSKLEMADARKAIIDNNNNSISKQIVDQVVRQTYNTTFNGEEIVATYELRKDEDGTQRLHEVTLYRKGGKI